MADPQVVQQGDDMFAVQPDGSYKYMQPEVRQGHNIFALKKDGTYEYSRAAPHPESPQQYAEDIAKSAGVGLGETAIGTVGALGGDVRELSANAVNWLSKQLGYEVSPETAEKFIGQMPLFGGTVRGLPSSRQLRELTEKQTGKFYEPQSEWGEAAKLTGEVAPQLFGGEAGLVTRLGTRIILPVLAGHELSKLPGIEGTRWEPWARSLGTVVGSAKGAALEALAGVMRRLTPAGRRAVAAEADAMNYGREAKELGVDVTEAEAYRDVAKQRELAEARKGAYGLPAQEKALAAEAGEAQQIEAAGQRLGEKISGGPMRDPEELAGMLKETVGERAQGWQGRVAKVETAMKGIEDEAASTLQREVQERTGMLDDERRALADIIAGNVPKVGSATEAAEAIGQSLRERGAANPIRAAYDAYAKRFGIQRGGDDVAVAIRKIVEKNATPEEMADMLVGTGSATSIGKQGLPVRLAEHLGDMFGRTSDTWNLLRQAALNKAMSVYTKAGEFDGLAAARNMFSLADSTLGKTLYEPHVLDGIRGTAQSIRDLSGAIANIQERAAKEIGQAKVVAATVGTRYRQAFEPANRDIGGKLGTMFERLVTGKANPQEIMHSVFDAIGSGSPDAARFIEAIHKIYDGRGYGPQMAMIREGVFGRLIGHLEGQPPTRAQLHARLNDFFNGNGKAIAEELYSPNQIADARKLIRVIERTITPSSEAQVVGQAPQRGLDILRARLSRYGSTGAGLFGGLIGEQVASALVHTVVGGALGATGGAAAAALGAHYLFRRHLSRMIDKLIMEKTNIRSLLRPLQPPQQRGRVPLRPTAMNALGQEGVLQQETQQP